MKNEKTAQELSEKELAALIAQSEAIDASAIKEAQEANAKAEREEKVRRYQGALKRIDASVNSAVVTLRNARKAERDARDRVNQFDTARALFVAKGDASELAKLTGYGTDVSGYRIHALGLAN